MNEPLYSFNITIILPNGRVVTTRELAYTNYHAIDKAYTKHSDKQSDRTKYTAKKPIIRLR